MKLRRVPMPAHLRELMTPEEIAADDAGVAAAGYVAPRKRRAKSAPMAQLTPNTAREFALRDQLRGATAKLAAVRARLMLVWMPADQLFEPQAVAIREALAIIDGTEPQ